MDLPKMIVELHAERHRIDEAIEALERLSAAKLRRRGRPPNWLREELQRREPAAEGTEETAPPGRSKKD